MNNVQNSNLIEFLFLRISLILLKMKIEVAVLGKK